jgi:hypothetical protein
LVFVRLAREMGWGTRDIAYALALTPRRIRQLAEKAPPTLPLAFTALSDPRLRVVP